MATSTTRKEFRQKVLKKLYRGRYPIASTTTAVGTGTTNMEDSALVGGALDNDYLRAWIYIVETVTSGPVYGEVSRVTNQSTGDLTLSPAFTATPQTGTDYEMHYVFHPNEVNDALDEVLEKVTFPTIVPISLLQNPIFDTWTSTSAATGYSVTNAALLQETTTVLRGRYSAKVTDSGSGGGFLYTASLRTYPGKKVFCSTHVYISTIGDSATFQLLDNGNNVIESAYTAQLGWNELSFTTTTESAVTGDMSYYLKIIANTASSSVYVDDVTIHYVGAKEANPGTLTTTQAVEFSEEIKSFFYFPRGAEVTTVTAATTANDHAYEVGQTSPKFFSHFNVQRDELRSRNYAIHFEKGLPERTVWMLIARDFPAFTGSTVAAKDADTTPAPMDLAVPLATVMLLDQLAEKYEEQGNDRRAAVMQSRADRIRAREIDPLIRKWYTFTSLIEGAI